MLNQIKLDLIIRKKVLNLISATMMKKFLKLIRQKGKSLSQKYLEISIIKIKLKIKRSLRSIMSMI